MTFEQAEIVAAAIAELPGIIRGERAAPATGMRAPFRVEDREGSFKVVDASGYAIATTYCDDPRAGDLTHDEARRIAINIAKVLGPAP